MKRTCCWQHKHQRKQRSTTYKFSRYTSGQAIRQFKNKLFADEMSMIRKNTNENEYFPIMRIPCLPTGRHSAIKNKLYTNEIICKANKPWVTDYIGHFGHFRIDLNGSRE
jgi:hypothetical protein